MIIMNKNLTLKLKKNKENHRLSKKNEKLIEEKKQLMNDIILIENKNKENEKKIRFL